MADGRRPYRRLSNLSRSIDPGFGLATWKLRHVMLSIARRPDLLDLLRGMTYQDGKAIGKIAEEALIRAKDDDTDSTHKLLAAHKGTAFHQFTEPGRPEPDPIFGYSLADYVVAKEQFEEALVTARLEVVSSEQFVVNDRLASAGTYDHLVRDLDTGTVHLIDKKTGGMHWLSHAVQLEGYATAEHYDPVTGRRSPLHEDLDVDLGFIAATDLDTGKCIITEIHLTTGKADLADAVHYANSAEGGKLLLGKRRA
jgi:hypothetical protein